MSRLSCILSLAVVLLRLPVLAEVTLPTVFGDNMVLQREQCLRIWGWAEPGEAVTVDFGSQRRRATPDSTGRWQVMLRPLAASSVPAKLIVSGANRLVLTNLLVGDVWLCSGQSNMEKPIGESPRQKPVPNHLEELANSDHPQIRLFKVEKRYAATPQRDVRSQGWFLSSSNAHEQLKFSAAAYFFGREIHQQVGVPVGLIESAWGGTRIEPWTPPVGFESVRVLRRQVTYPQPGDELSNRTPTGLYNAMIAPLVPFGISGALWYQGESNLIDNPDGRIYTDKMEALIEGWREVWGLGEFPFYYVQLAPYRYYSDRETPRAPSAESLPEMWEAQEDALRVSGTGMIVTTDLVDDVRDIHPRNKQDVGKRLAWLALADTYGQKDVVASGPVFRRAKFVDGRAILRFKHAEGGLFSRDGLPLSWFTIAGKDGRFVPADAVTEGETVVVFNPDVTDPQAVRFAWHEKAMPNLCNQAGLPARPFRTDRP